MTNYKFPTAFVSHGGGPWPIISIDTFEEAERSELKAYMESICKIPKHKPAALLVISAHWEGPDFTINTNPDVQLLFDYYGFPPESYEFKWPAKNDLVLVARVKELLADKNIHLNENDKRDYDHGIFIPLLLAYPQAEVPVVQISLKRNLDPLEHIKLGEALSPLREEGVFIIGSGNSYHNLNYLFNPTTKAIKASKAFDSWLKETLALDGNDRNMALINWTNAPSAKESHPREEHLIPLLVSAGAAKDDKCIVSWTGHINGTSNSAFHFES